MPKYRYTVTYEGVLEADDEQDAEGVALFKCEAGLSHVTIEVEQVRENGEQT